MIEKEDIINIEEYLGYMCYEDYRYCISSDEIKFVKSLENLLSDYKKFYYYRGYELYEFMIQQRLFIENLSNDLLKKSIDILKYEKKRRKKEDLKFIFAFIKSGGYRNI